MPRKCIFHQKRPTPAERTILRKLCASLTGMGRTHAGRAQLADLLDPIEPSLILPLLADIADGTGYQKSKLSLVCDRKAYYLRKNHVYDCIFSRMQDKLGEQIKGGTTNG